MFENWLKTITFTEILDDFYTIIKQHDLIEQRAGETIFYNLHSETKYWLVRMDCVRHEDGGLFPYKISYGLSGRWVDDNGRMLWCITLDEYNIIEENMERKSFKWWQEERKKIDKRIAQIRHEEIAMKKRMKQIELIRERQCGLTMF